MRKILTIVITGFILYSCSSSKRNITYLDSQNREISKSKFQQRKSSHEFLSIQIDSLNQRKLTEKTKTGEIDNLNTYRSLISNISSEDIDVSKPLVIIYYPGKDPCNSSGSATGASLKTWYDNLENGLRQLNTNAPVYLYKEKEGLEKYEGLMDWHKDPDGLTEKLFFEYHYPCSSFVVISPNGEYVSYFGEFGKTFVWNAVNLISD